MNFCQWSKLIFGNWLIDCVLILSVCIPNLIYANRKAKNGIKKQSWR